MIPERRKSLRIHSFNVGKLYFDRLEEEMEAKKWEVTKMFWFENTCSVLGAAVCVGIFYLAILILWR